MSQPGAEKEPNRLHPKAKRPKASARGESRRIFVTGALDLIILNL
jgi:hypothetical protein